jgi:hypothetical protein
MMTTVARRDFIDEKTRPPSAVVVETADDLLKRLDDGDCVDLHEVAADLGVGVKTVRNAINWLRDSRIVITFMDGQRCWLGRRGYTPDWDEITIGQANQMGLFAPWELRRLRAARTFQLPRLSNPSTPEDWSAVTVGDAVEVGILGVAEACRVCCAARYERAKIKQRLLAY